LHVYDILVYRFYAPIIWRCPEADLVELYEKHVSSRHLDIGVGTGSLIDRSEFPAPEPQLTLMDLTPSSLRFATERLHRYAPRTHTADVLKPWGLPARSFDSVAMVNVLHCAPGTMRDKATAFDQASTALTPGGCLFGATILAEGVEHTGLSRRVMKSLNRRKIFANASDRLEDLDAVLGDAFATHEIKISGAAALFAAWTESDGASGNGPSGAGLPGEEIIA
jgi:SAM-dependent methyltransferase